MKLLDRFFRRTQPGRHRPGAIAPSGRHAFGDFTPRAHRPSVLVEHTLPLSRAEIAEALDADRDTRRTAPFVGDLSAMQGGR